MGNKTVCVYLRSHFDGYESSVDFEVDDNASDEEISKEASNIAEQYYSETSDWEIVN